MRFHEAVTVHDAEEAFEVDLEGAGVLLEKLSDDARLDSSEVETTSPDERPTVSKDTLVIDVQFEPVVRAVDRVSERMALCVSLTSAVDVTLVSFRAVCVFDRVSDDVRDPVRVVFFGRGVVPVNSRVRTPDHSVAAVLGPELVCSELLEDTDEREVKTNLLPLCEEAVLEVALADRLVARDPAADENVLEDREPPVRVSRA